jgi:hypothetical protein
VEHAILAVPGLSSVGITQVALLYLPMKKSRSSCQGSTYGILRLALLRFPENGLIVDSDKSSHDSISENEKHTSPPSTPSSAPVR